MANDPALQDRAGMPHYSCSRGMIRSKVQKGVDSRKLSRAISKVKRRKQKRERWCWHWIHPRLTNCTDWFSLLLDFRHQVSRGFDVSVCFLRYVKTLSFFYVIGQLD
jgi:hypothetical protein